MMGLGKGSMGMKTRIWLGVALLMCGGLVRAVDGPALYETHCAKCHGATGQADSWRGYLFFSRDFSSAKWQAARTDEEILEKIDQGPRIMPPYKDKLSAEERAALVNVVRSFGRKP